MSMTEQTKVIEIIAAYDALVERFCEITRDVPQVNRCNEPGYARLAIDDIGTATLVWPEAVSGEYDDNPCIEEEKNTLPVEVLFMSSDDLSTWKAEQHRLFSERIKANRVAAAQAQTDRERAQFEALKRKFEP